MTAFTLKKIEPEESPGEKLRLARQYKNISIAKASEKTGIRAEYLVALEESRFDQLPAGLYGKNFLKEYSAFLGLDYRELLKKLDETAGESWREDPFSQKTIEKSQLLVFPKIIKNILIGAAILACFLYLLFYFKKIFLAPELIISQPPRNIMTSESSIIISGQTQAEAEIKINGETVLSDTNGNFSQTVNLKKGLNNISISVKKKYSREKIITRQILVE